MTFGLDLERSQGCDSRAGKGLPERGPCTGQAPEGEWGGWTVAEAQGEHRGDVKVGVVECGQEPGSRRPAVGPLGALEPGSDTSMPGWRRQTCLGRGVRTVCDDEETPCPLNISQEDEQSD